jgi:hypothetical protein
MLKANFVDFFFFLRLYFAVYSRLDSNSTIFLPQPPKCWDYKCAPPCLNKLEYFNVDLGHQQSFSVQSQKVNILGFVDHTLSVTTIQLCHCSWK